MGYEGQHLALASFPPRLDGDIWIRRPVTDWSWHISGRNGWSAYNPAYEIDMAATYGFTNRYRFHSAQMQDDLACDPLGADIRGVRLRYWQDLLSGAGTGFAPVNSANLLPAPAQSVS